MSAIKYETVYEDGGGGGGGTTTTSRSTASGTSTSRTSGTSSSSTSSSTARSVGTNSDGTVRSTSNNTVVTTGSRSTGGSTSRGRHLNTESFYFKDVPSDWKIYMNPGETLELHLQVSSKARPEITFESSNTMVASVTKTQIVVCKVTARGIGTCTIRAYYTNAESGIFYEAELTLYSGPVNPDLDAIPEDHKIWMAIGEKRTITIQENPTSTSVESSNPSIATFAKNYVNTAVLTAVSPGVCVIRYILDRRTVIDSYYVIVGHGNGTEYLDVFTFEKSKSWESLNLGSVFVVACGEKDTTGRQGAVFRSNILKPEGWRDLVVRSYKELKVSKLGQEISIKVTPPEFLEDKESEDSWIDYLSSLDLPDSSSSSTEEGTEESTTTEEPEIYCNFLGIGVYKFIINSNCPVRFKTSSNKISLGPWNGEIRSEYILSDFGNSRVLPVHVLELPGDSTEIIDFSYECIDGRDHNDFKIKLWPCLPGVIDTRGPYIFIVPGESDSYNQKIELKSYGEVKFSGIEYPRERRANQENVPEERWTSDLSEACVTIRSKLRVSLSSTPYVERRADDPGALKYFITLRSVTGYEVDVDELPVAPVARIRFDVSEPFGEFDPVNIVVKHHVYYYIYVLPQIPIRNIDTYEPIDRILTDFTTFGIKCSVFERLRAQDFNACWPGTNVKFVDTSGMYDCFSVKYPENYANYGTRNDHGVMFDIMWADTEYSWNHRPLGSELGTIVIKWYYNRDYVIFYDGLFNYYYLEDGYNNMTEPPYNPNNQFYTQTVHFIKGEGYAGHIKNKDELPTHYSALGTYDPVTLEPDYKIIKTDLTFNKNHPFDSVPGYYSYVFREEEIYDTPIKYTCTQDPGYPQFLNLTIEPRGNNASFSLGDWESLRPYYSIARGEIKLVKEGKERYGNGSREFSTVLDTFSFEQEGLEDCILFKDRFYLGRSEITLPDVDYMSFNLSVGGYGIKSYKIPDVLGLRGELDKAREIDGGITVKIYKNDETEPFFTETATSFNNICTIPENEYSEIIYTIEITHKEEISTVSASGAGFESKIIAKLKQKSKSSDVYLNDNRKPAIYSYGSLEKGIVFYTSIPKNKIWVEEVIQKDSNGKWIVGKGTANVARIDAYIEETPDPEAPEGYKCYICHMSFSPNAAFIPIGGDTYLGEERIRRIRIRHLDTEDGNVYELKQGYYSLYPTLMYRAKEDDTDLTIITEKDCRSDAEVIPMNSVVYSSEEGLWKIGSRSNPIKLPPFRNAGSNEDLNKVWISLMAMQHEIRYGDGVRWVNTTNLFNKGALEIESNSRILHPDTMENGYDYADLSEDTWFNDIQTDIIIRSTDTSSELTKTIIGSIPGEDTEKEGKKNKEDIEFPALETIYTASGAGFYERQVLIQETVELGLGVLTDEGDILYDGPNAYTVNNKVQIWYRKIGEDIKDE